MLKRTFTIFTIAVLGLHSPARAADEASASSSTNYGSQALNSASQAAKGDAEGQRSGAGQALDAASLASKAMCSTLTMAAMATQDPAKKEKYKEMAMLACMQAAANQQSGNQNNSNAEKFIDIPQPQMPNFSNSVKTPNDTSDGSELLASGGSQTPSRNYSSDPGLINIPDIKVPDLSGGKNSKADPGNLSTSKVGGGFGDEGFIPLEPTPPKGLTYETDNQATPQALGANAAPMSLASKSTDATTPTPTPNVAAAGAPPSFRSPASVNTASADGTDAVASNGDAAFDNLMAQLMGGGSPMEASFGGFGGNGTISFLPFNTQTGKRGNIFEFASDNFRAAREQNRVKSSGFRVSSN